MKKIISFAVALLVIPVLGFAAFQPATLTNGVKRVAVYTQEQANALFAIGYSIEKKVGGSSNTQYVRQFNLAGTTNGGSVVAISTTSASYTLTPTDICTAGQIKVTPLGAAVTVTLPATSTGLFAKCLPTVGSFMDINYQSVATSTTIAAGAGGTLGYTSAASVAANKYGIIRLLRTAASTYHAYLVNIPN